jgi:hypothetical protein
VPRSWRGVDDAEFSGCGPTCIWQWPGEGSASVEQRCDGGVCTRDAAVARGVFGEARRRGLLDRGDGPRGAAGSGQRGFRWRSAYLGSDRSTVGWRAAGRAFPRRPRGGPGEVADPAGVYWSAPMRVCCGFGARILVRWCRRRGAPTRVRSGPSRLWRLGSVLWRCAVARTIRYVSGMCCLVQSCDACMARSRVPARWRGCRSATVRWLSVARAPAAMRT